MSEHNKQVVSRFYQEVLSGGRLDLVDELVTADHVMHDTSEPGLLMGAESARRWTEARRIAFPDLAITIDDEIRYDPPRRPAAGSRWAPAAARPVIWEPFLAHSWHKSS